MKNLNIIKREINKMLFRGQNFEMKLKIFDECILKTIQTKPSTSPIRVKYILILQ